LGIDDIAHLDLYSCFGSSVNFACDALGLSAGDSRPLTVTGGLPFFGGAGNNYVSHSVVTMIEKLRGEPAVHGMVSGVGMHMTNHVFGIYSATPGSAVPPDAAAAQARVAAVPVCAIRDTASGAASVAAYSVVHSREGPAWGLAICDLPEGDRCYARVDDGDLMRSMESEEWVGRAVELEDARNQVNRICG
jgi:acetyl-CoA C-acetyltransferase